MIEMYIEKLSVIMTVENEQCVVTYSSPSNSSISDNTDHSALTESSRNLPAQHTIEAITNLRKTISAIEAKLGKLQVNTFSKEFSNIFN